MLSLEGSVVLRVPHLLADSQRFLQPLEPFGYRWEGNAEATMLPLVPGGTDPERGPAAGQHVERGHDLGEQARMPVGHAGDEQAESYGRGVSGQVAKRCVALQHRILGPT